MKYELKMTLNDDASALYKLSHMASEVEQSMSHLRAFINETEWVSFNCIEQDEFKAITKAIKVLTSIRDKSYLMMLDEIDTQVEKEEFCINHVHEYEDTTF